MCFCSSSRLNVRPRTDGTPNPEKKLPLTMSALISSGSVPKRAGTPPVVESGTQAIRPAKTRFSGRSAYLHAHRGVAVSRLPTRTKSDVCR